VPQSWQLEAVLPALNLPLVQLEQPSALVPLKVPGPHPRQASVEPTLKWPGEQSLHVVAPFGSTAAMPPVMNPGPQVAQSSEAAEAAYLPNGQSTQHEVAVSTNCPASHAPQSFPSDLEKAPTGHTSHW